MIFLAGNIYSKKLAGALVVQPQWERMGRRNSHNHKMKI
jgi:hypothetical protein